MKRTLLVLLWSVLCVQCLRAQTIIGRQLVDSFPVFNWSVYPSSGLNYGLTWLPPDYASNPTKKYPLIVFLHGVGESANGTPSPSTLPSLLHSGSGIAYNISAGWSATAVNPADGQTYEFIVVSPQNSSGWSDNYDQLKYIVPNILSRYRVDPNRIFLTGLSAGGDGTWTVAGSGDAAFIQQFAAMATASAAQADGANSLTQTQVQSNIAQLTSQDGVPVWAVAGDQDALDEYSIAYTDTVNDPNPNPKAKFTLVKGIGHSSWQQLYDTTWRPGYSYYGTNGWSMVNSPLEASPNDGQPKGTGVTPDSLNVFEWFLMHSKNQTTTTPPPATANAGTAQTITLPTSSLNVDGSGSTGTISSYAWTEVSGPATVTFASPSAAKSSVNGLTTAGSYVFQLSVNGGASTATVTETVNAASAAPVANAGGDPTITLPTSTVSLDGSGSTGTITSYLWTEVSGPVTATIGTPTTATTTVSGLTTAGTYVFQLSLNGGVSTSTVTVIVNATTTTGTGGTSGSSGCNGHKYTLTENADSAIWELPGSYTYNYQPGDTIVIPHNPNANGYWAWVTFVGLAGNSACPIVITNDNVAQTLIKGQLQLDGCTYVKLTGTGASSVNYGFKLEYDPVLRYQTKGGVYVFDKSKDVEINHCYIHNVGTGIAELTDNNCDQSYDYPNWVLDSMLIDNNMIVGTWNEGMYLGNTSPDNNYYDARPDQCSVAQSTPTYSIPAKTGYTHVFNNILDSTGRGGIQLANAGGTSAVSEINNNVCTHNGMNNDDAQGTAISIGLYTKAYIHDNTISCTYTWGIASLGGGWTNVPIRVENNHIDSSGYLNGWNRIATTGDDVFNPATEPITRDSLTWPYPIEIDTKPKSFTQASGGSYNPGPGAPYGTAVQGQDSTEYWIKNNVIGRFKGGDAGGSQPNAIQIHDYDTSVQTYGNIVCNNTSTLGWPITVLAADNNGHLLTYTNTCSVNLPPTVSAGTNQTITLPTSTVTLAGTVTPNNGATIVRTTWTQFSGPTTATITSPTALGTTVTGLAQGTYIFQLTAVDNDSLSGSATVTIVVNPPVVNTPPTVSAGSNQTITLPTSTVTLTGTATGNNGATISSTTWTEVSGPTTATISASTSLSTAVSGLAQGTYVFKLSATDNNAQTSTATVTVTVDAAVVNVPPTVSAGSNQTITLPASTVTLTGTATGNNGATISSTTWTEVSGPTTATISASGSLSTAVSGLAQGTYVFKLSATDNNAQTSTATVTVTVDAAVVNVPPTVSAGSNQTITLPASTATLTGTATGNNGATISSTTWTEVSGPTTATISASGSLSTTVSGLAQGSYTFKLSATDNNGQTSTATVTVTVNDPSYTPPTVSAGSNQTITLPTSTATLTGTATGNSGATISSTTWTEVSGPTTATISASGSLSTTVSGLAQGAYVFQLTATDNNGQTSTATVTITVNAAVNTTPPTVSAGSNQTITLPVSSTGLTGTATGNNGATISSTTWTEVSGPSTATISAAGSLATTVSGLDSGVYVFKLTATDNGGLSSSATVTVTVKAAPHQPPVANAGPDQTLTAPVTQANLDGSASYDPGGTIVTWSWVQLSGPGGVTLGGATTDKPTLYGLKTGTYVFELTVTDNWGLSASAQVTITVNAGTGPAATLVANAGTDTTLELPADLAVLNGSASYASNSTIVSYSWSQVSGPSGATINTPLGVSTTVSPLTLGTYVFKLTVMDAAGDIASDSVTVEVVNALRTSKSMSALYPNPVPGNAVTLDLLNSETGTTVVTICAMNGSPIQQFIYDKQSDELKEQLNLIPLAKGVYLVKVQFANGHRVVLKMVKQ